EALVGRALGMVKLVDNDHFEMVRRDRFDAVSRQRLDGCEDMPPLLGARTADVQLPEGRLVQNMAKGGEALFEDLLAVGDEEQAQVLAELASKAAVVESGHDRFSRSGRRPRGCGSGCAPGVRRRGG